MHDDESPTTNGDGGDTAAPEHEPFPVHHVEPTVELSPMEARVLGALIEKSFTTPDGYPMTTNSIVTACNQKTSRDPVVSYSANEVDATLLELRQRSLVRRVHTQGARSSKHRHTFDEVLPLDPRQVVLVSVLLLRGDQTAGELRTRTERHGVFSAEASAHLSEVRECLEGLAGRATPLVNELARQSGQKDTRWRHLLLDASAASEPLAAPNVATGVDGDRADDVPAATRSAGTASAAASPSPSRPEQGGERRSFADRVDQLEVEVARLRAQLDALASSLGEELA